MTVSPPRGPICVPYKATVDWKLNDWITCLCVNCLVRLTGCSPAKYTTELWLCAFPMYIRTYVPKYLLYQPQRWNESAAVTAVPSPWCNSPRPLWSLQNLVFLWRLVCSAALGSWFLGQPTQTQQTPGGGRGWGRGWGRSTGGGRRYHVSTQVQTTPGEVTPDRRVSGIKEYSLVAHGQQHVQKSIAMEMDSLKTYRSWERVITQNQPA